RQQFDLTMIAAHQPRLGERLRSDLTADLLQVVEANDLGLLAEGVGEAPLGQATRHRHLAALERGLAAARTMVAGARLDALVSLARRLALAGPRTPADALAVAMRAARRREVVKS